MSDIAISSRSCTERHGDFSESVVFHSSYEVSCFLFVFWLGCLVFVLVVCLCWLLLGGWMGDTLGFVSLYSHAWEWTISTNRLLTVRASSAHGTGKKKKIFPEAKQRQCFPADTNLGHKCKGIKEVLHAQGTKKVLIQNKCVRCGGIQQNTRLPVSLSVNEERCTEVWEKSSVGE